VDLGKQDIFVLDAGLNPILEATLWIYVTRACSQLLLALKRHSNNCKMNNTRAIILFLEYCTTPKAIMNIDPLIFIIVILFITLYSASFFLPH
jgi:hypothetical protein